MAENEERWPWEPLHVKHGSRKDENTVSLFGFRWHTAFTLVVREKHRREHVARMLRGMDARCRALVVLDPIACRQFVDRGGFEAGARFRDRAYDGAKIPAEAYWDDRLIRNFVYLHASFGQEPYASRLKAAPTDLVHMFQRDQSGVVVGGGETYDYWRIISADCNKTVFVDEWRSGRRGN